MSAAPDEMPTDDPSADLPLLEEAVGPVATEPIDEDLESDVSPKKATPTVGPNRLPNAGRAFVWVLLLFGTQLILGLVIGLGLAATMIGDGQMPRDPSSMAAEIERSASRILIPVGSFAMLVTAIAVVVVAFRKETSRCMGLRGMTLTQVLLVLLSVVPCALLASEVTNCATEVLPNVSMDLFAEFANESWWLIFVAACLFPGLGEELFFRGFLSRGLVAHHGPWLGALITAFYFGAIHLHPIQACGAFTLGLFLQFVFLTTRSLWGAVLLHTANNALAFGAMRYGHLVPIPGFTTNSADQVSDTSPAPHFDELIANLNGTGTISHTAPLLLFAAMISVAAISWAMLRTRTRWLRPDGTEWSRGFISAEGPRPEVAVQTVAGSLDAVTGAALVLANGVFFAALYFHVQR